jgi:hypothetical protein
VIPDLGRALTDGIEALEAAGVRYAMVGGLAVSAWATPRATGDADLYAELPERVRGAVERGLQDRGFHVPAMQAELERFGVFRSRSAAGIFLDVFDSAGPLGQAILDRRREVAIEGRRVWTIAPEDKAADVTKVVYLNMDGLDEPVVVDVPVAMGAPTS